MSFFFWGGGGLKKMKGSTVSYFAPPPPHPLERCSGRTQQERGGGLPSQQAGEAEVCSPSYVPANSCKVLQLQIFSCFRFF